MPASTSARDAADHDRLDVAGVGMQRCGGWILVWVHCASGYRASIAASIIDEPDRTVVLIDDTIEHAGNLHLVS